MSCRQHPGPLMSQLSLLGCGMSGGEASHRAEVTQIDTTGHGSNQHGKHFLISDANGRVSVTMDAGTASQSIQVSFDGMGEADFDTGGVGYYLFIRHASGVAQIWFNSGAESAPDPTGFDSQIQVYVAGLADDQAIREAFETAVFPLGFTGGGSSGAISVLLDNSAGLRGASGNINVPSPFSLVMISLGRDAAVDPGTADRNIMVSINNGESDSDLATTLASALSLDGAWTANPGSATVDVTDVATGARLDAADVSTGFAITVTQQGA